MVRGISSCCRPRHAVSTCRFVAKQSIAVSKNSVVTNAAAGLLNHSIMARNGTLNTFYKTATVDQISCAAAALPSTLMMTGVSALDTLFENVRFYDPSWLGVLSRKGPGAVMMAAAVPFFGLTALEAAGFYTFVRVVDVAAKKFVNFSEGHDVHKIPSLREFFANLGHIVTREEYDQKEEEKYQKFIEELKEAATKPQDQKNEGFFKKLFRNRFSKTPKTGSKAAKKANTKSEKKE